MRRVCRAAMPLCGAVSLGGLLFSSSVAAAQKYAGVATATTAYPTSTTRSEPVLSNGSVTVEGKSIAYRAVAGTIQVTARKSGDTQSQLAPITEDTPQAAMSYVAYFRKGVIAADRPITFFFQGGPGWSTIYLHNAFGPRRVLTNDDTPTPPAPYKMVGNLYSLLNVSDLVFVDAPGTGFGQITGKDRDSAFFSIDADALAFTAFIKDFIGRFDRWNSPKFLLGESYGSPRSALVLSDLQANEHIDVNGLILMGQSLTLDLPIDNPTANPGGDEAYVMLVPAFAATAWYHNRVPGGRPTDLNTFLAEAESFANTDYLLALQMGSALDDVTRQRVAEKLARFSGLQTQYILDSNLRVSGGQFAKQLLKDKGLILGRLDGRFTSSALDPLAKEAEYEPTASSITSAYLSAFNDYARRDLGMPKDQPFKPNLQVIRQWDFRHRGVETPLPLAAATNVMPDLASAMVQNPSLKVMTAGGYFDLRTPYLEALYEMRHLPIPAWLRSNIQFHFYRSGHQLYANERSLSELHSDISSFIRRSAAQTDRKRPLQNGRVSQGEAR